MITQKIILTASEKNKPWSIQCLKMHKTTLIILTLMTSAQLNAQTERFTVNHHDFEITTEVIDNEWETKDTLQSLYRMEEDVPTKVLTFYAYKDDGGDCNNLFWNKESLTIEGDSLIFTTHYFQKTGIDPIHEWRKQIYEVNAAGKLILKYDKYRYYHSTEWVDS